MHEWRDDLRARYANWRESNPETVIELVKKKAREGVAATEAENDPDDFSHLYR